MWLVVLIFLIVAEAVTVQMIAVWFALGALGALIAAFFGVDIIIQLVVFIVISLITLIASRPLVKKIMARRISKTNFDRIVSMTGVVIEEINNLAATGYISVDGKDWMARTEKEEIIEGGEKVKVVRIEGAKVIVEREYKNGITSDNT